MNINLFPNAQRRGLLPRVVSCSPRMKILIATVALSSVWQSSAAAACGSAAQRIHASVFAAQPLPLQQESASDSTPDSGPGPATNPRPSPGFGR
jgi:hypothetical protein